MGKKKILIVAAHPDDEVLGCGGTIARRRSEGDIVRVLFLAEGVTARYSFTETIPDQAEIRSIERNENAKAALGILGVKTHEIFVSSRRCCRLDQTHELELTQEVEQHIREFGPEIVYTHSPHDVNVDHRVTHKAVIAASRPLTTSSVREVHLFEVGSSTEWNTLHPFAPSVFVDISGFLNLKIKAMYRYFGEINDAPHPRSKEVIQAQAIVRGAQAGMEYAEGFALFRLIDKANP